MSAVRKTETERLDGKTLRLAKVPQTIGDAMTVIQNLKFQYL